MRTRFLLCGALAAGLLVAGCGGDNSAPTTTVAAATTTPATTAPTATTAGATTTAAMTVEEHANAALLTPEEVGPGFAADTWTPNDPKQPTPCGTPSADATVPAT